jgi:hypothetical protein
MPSSKKRTPHKEPQADGVDSLLEAARHLDDASRVVIRGTRPDERQEPMPNAGSVSRRETPHP